MTIMGRKIVKIEPDYFKKHVYYSPESPTGLRWLNDRSNGRNWIRRKAKSIAGSTTPSSCGYYTICFEGKTLLCHRVVWSIVNGPLSSSDFIDHIDGNKYNNCIENLRVVSRTVNNRNAKKRHDNTSGVTGVSLLTNGNYRYWMASWKEGGKQVSKLFSINKLGDMEAFSLAQEARLAAIEGLNKEGAKYSKRHGDKNG